MPAPARKSATYADLEAVPPHLVAEILFGELVTHPRPVPRHGAATAAAADVLMGPFQRGIGGPGGWVFLVEPELHLGHHVVVPDLAAWKRDRLTGDAVDQPFVDIAPDWVLEVLSPSTERYDKGKKRRIYAEAGVGHLWHLDPRSRSLDTFALTDVGWTVGASYFGQDDVTAPPFDATTFSLGLMWPFDDPGKS